MTTTAFATFKASKRRSETLADDLGIDAHSVSQGGYLYDGGHYIEDNTLGCAETQAQGKHHLAIGQKAWIGDDLDALEKILWSQQVIHEHGITTVGGDDRDAFADGEHLVHGYDGVFRVTFDGLKERTLQSVADLIDAAAMTYGLAGKK